MTTVLKDAVDTIDKQSNPVVSKSVILRCLLPGDEV